MYNTVKIRSGRTLVLPTPEEDAEINRGIAADPDTFDVPSEDFKLLRRRGRPRLGTTKEQVSVRYDADILAAFRATGEGWQTRMNDALRTYLAEHPLEEASTWTVTLNASRACSA
jgi:uncharacterized protein (DUF4415 family)